jgi:hypothetical protein
MDQRQWYQSLDRLQIELTGAANYYEAGTIKVYGIN